MKAQILLIEDESILRDPLEAILLRAGHGVWPVSHGREALEILGRLSVDLVVTDILMPELDGIETIMKIRQQQPHLPIIAMSGGGQVPPAQYLRMARMVGATRVLAKPFEPVDLLGLIDGLLASSTPA